MRYYFRTTDRDACHYYFYSDLELLGECDYKIYFNHNDYINKGFHVLHVEYIKEAIETGSCCYTNNEYWGRVTIKLLSEDEYLMGIIQ